MNRDFARGIGGLVLMLPAWILCSTGMLGLEPPLDIVHPVLVLGGLAGALSLNLQSVCRLRTSCKGGAFVGTVAVLVRDRLLNLAVLALGVGFAVLIAAYVVVENLTVR